MPKLFLSLLVKNEADNFLSEILDFYGPIVDGIIALDNGSTDNTVALLKAHPKLLKVDRDIADFQSQETALRTHLFSLYPSYVQENDWILTVDADELMEDRFKTQVKKMMERDVWWYSFRFLHFWGSRKHYRVDGLWAPKMWGPRMFRWTNKDRYKWANVPFACGSMPTSIYRKAGIRSDIFVLHLGYVKPDAPQRKYQMYSTGVAADHHAKAHIESIIQPPTLEEWCPTRQ